MAASGFVAGKPIGMTSDGKLGNVEGGGGGSDADLRTAFNNLFSYESSTRTLSITYSAVSESEAG